MAAVATTACVDEHTDQFIRRWSRSVCFGHAVIDVELKGERYVLVETSLLPIHIPSEALEMTNEDGGCSGKP